MTPQSSRRDPSDPNPQGAISYSSVAGVLLCLIFMFLAPVVMRQPVGGRGAARAAGRAAAVVGAANAFCGVAVKAPMPSLQCDAPAVQFRALRQAVAAGAGFDFLATCGDLLRDTNFKSSKPGVADDSKHKAGRAFDYNQGDHRLLVVREPAGGRAYWRTYLLCERQDGSCGVRLDLETENAGRVSAYVFDFTAAAEGLGWERVPAQHGWERSPTKREFWHYEMKDAVETAGADDTPAEAKPSAFTAPFRYLADIISPREAGP